MAIASVAPSSHSSFAVWSSLTTNCGVKEVRIMGVLMCTMMYSIWKTRNQFLHRQCQPNVSSICNFFSAEGAFNLQMLSKSVNSPSLRKIMLFLGISPSLSLDCSYLWCLRSIGKRNLGTVRVAMVLFEPF